MKKVCLILLLLLSGCGVQKEIVDDIHIVTALGYDYIEEDLFEGTAIVPIYTTDKTLNQETYTSRSVLSKSMADSSNLKSSEPLANGKLVIVIYGKDLARKGIQKMFDTLIRDPSVGANVHLAIAEDKAKEILHTKKSDVEDIGINLSKLIEQNIRTGAIPLSNIHQFVDAFYEEGIDPTLPILKKLKDNDIKINGLGLFKGDKLVYSIDPSLFFAYRMLYESFDNGSYTVNLGHNDEYASIQNITTKTRVKVKNPESDSPIFNYKIKVNGNIKEYSGNKLTPKVQKQIIKNMEKQLMKDSEELLQNFKEHNIDPIGLGRHIRMENRNWNESKWYDQLNNVHVNLDIKVNIIESGIIE